MVATRARPPRAPLSTGEIWYTSLMWSRVMVTGACPMAAIGAVPGGADTCGARVAQPAASAATTSRARPGNGKSLIVTWTRAGRSALDDAHLHVDALVRVVAAVAGGVHDLVRHLQAARHLAEGGVLPVEEGRVLHADEELAAGAVGVLGARHGDDA